MLLALVLAATLFPTSRAPQDASPLWSPDARLIAFHREEPAAADRAYVVPAGHGRDVRLGLGRVVAWRPDGGAVAIVSGTSTRIVTPDGRDLATVAGAGFGWSVDGRRFGYVAGDSILVADANGQDGVPVATFGPGATWDQGPVWSPDGSRIAFTSVKPGGLVTSLEVVDADGIGLRKVFTGPNQNVNASWSPDGRTLAFESNADYHFQVWTVRGDGTDAHRLAAEPSTNDRLPVWSPSGTAIAFISDRERRPGGASAYQYALYTMAPDGRSVRKLADDVHPNSRVQWSPTGAQLAFAAGRECQRWGIYDMRAAIRSTQRRRTNDCHIVGTPRADVLRGTPYLDFISGLGGNDRIRGGDGHDDLSGGAGADTLDGGPYGDWIFGGVGDDVIRGGLGPDLLVGGPGRDRILGGPGGDRILVRDGVEDVVACGAGTDEVEADRRDRIARDCEHVRRAQSSSAPAAKG